MLESYKNANNAFLTLTYSDEHLPPGGTLVKKHYQDFLKKLRSRLVYRASKYNLGTPPSVRYYFCGEYGEQSQRPHYHAALFGVGPEDAEEISKAWSRGFSFTGDLTHDSAQYIAGYVTKKMTHPEAKCTPQCKHPPLNGRLPEFAKPSLRPGIGASCVSDIADVLTTAEGCDAFARVGDVPYSLMLGNKSIPLGRYIRGKLRLKMGFEDTKMPPEAYHAYKAEMQKLQEHFKCTSEETSLSKYLDKRAKYQKFLIDQTAQKVLQLETKSKIFSAQRNTL